MDKMLKQAYEILGGVDFNAIWRGFAPREIAPPPHDGPCAGLLAVDLVCRMFSDFAREQGETRHPDRAALSAEPPDLDNWRLKMAENHYLVRAVTDSSMLDLQQFAMLRRVRRRIAGSALAQEQRAETVGGLAQFAGLAALSQISRAKFMDEMARRLKSLQSPHGLRDIGRAGDTTGCVICFALKSLGVDFWHEISDRRMLFDFIPRLPNEIEAAFEKWQEENGIYS